MTQPEWPPQQHDPAPPDWELRVAPLDLRWLSATALALDLLIVVLLSLDGHSALGLGASVVPLLAAGVAKILGERGQLLAVAALVVSLLPLALFVLWVGQVLTAHRS